MAAATICSDFGAQEKSVTVSIAVSIIPSGISHQNSCFGTLGEVSFSHRKWGYEILLHLSFELPESQMKQYTVVYTEFIL